LVNRPSGNGCGSKRLGNLGELAPARAITQALAERGKAICFQAGPPPDSGKDLAIPNT